MRILSGIRILDKQVKGHASLSRPDLVLRRKVKSSYSSMQVFSGMVSRRDMVQVPLEPASDLVVRKFYRPAKFGFVGPQRPKTAFFVFWLYLLSY